MFRPSDERREVLLLGGDLGEVSCFSVDLGESGGIDGAEGIFEFRSEWTL